MAADLPQFSQSRTKKVRWLSSRKLIIFSFLLVSIAPLCIIGFFSYFRSRNIIIQKSANYSLEMLTQTVTNIQLKLAELESVSVRLFINKEFNAALANYVRTATTDPTGVVRENITDYFNDYMISNKDIFAFMFIADRDQRKSVVIAKDYYSAFWDLACRFPKTVSCQNIITAGGGIVWSNTVEIRRNHFMVLGRQLKDATTGEPFGILAIVVEEEKIDQLTNLTLYNKLNISLGNMERFSFIINNDGVIISSPFKKDIGKNIAMLMENIRPLRPIMEYAGDRDYGSEVNQGSYITQVNHQQMLVTFKSIGSKIGVGGKSGWHLISVAPTSFLCDELQTVGLVTLILAVLFGGIATWISFRVAAMVSWDGRDTITRD